MYRNNVYVLLSAVILPHSPVFNLETQMTMLPTSLPADIHTEAGGAEVSVPDRFAL